MSIIVSGIDKEGIMLAIDSELMRYKFASTPENYDVVDVPKRVLNHNKTKIGVVKKISGINNYMRLEGE